MKVKSKFWLEDEAGETIFGEGRRRILELIDELGSMQATAKALGMSYRGVWARVKTTEERVGMKLVETSVGRGKNRGSRLTDEAKKLLADFKLLNQKGMKHTDQVYDEVFQGQEKETSRLVPAVSVVAPGIKAAEELAGRLAGAFRRRGVRTAVLTPDKGKSGGREDALADAPLVIRTRSDRIEVRFSGAANLTDEAVAANFAHGCDLALAVGNQRAHLPTIEIFSGQDKAEMITRKAKDLLAIVGTRPDKVRAPAFDPDDLDGMMDYLEEKVLAPSRQPLRVELVVDGRRVPMLPFVQDIFENAVAGMVSALKSCENPRDIEFRVSGHQGMKSHKGN